MTWKWQVKRDDFGSGHRYHVIIRREGSSERRSATARSLIGCVLRAVWSKPFAGSYRGEGLRPKYADTDSKEAA